ncbi:MAG TPA: hypothetical protein VFG35_11140 [Actinoplanes sp.]|nr:hypothetical protein [Actinoplanes sp.]
MLGWEGRIAQFRDVVDTLAPDEVIAGMAALPADRPPADPAAFYRCPVAADADELLRSAGGTN